MEALLKELKARNIAVSLNNDGLKVKFNGSELPADLLERIKEQKENLVAYLQKIQEKKETGTIEPATPAESYPLSSSQLRLWLLSQVDDNSIAFHIQGAAYFDGSLNTKVLEDAFRALITRHEILRTVFKQDATGEVRQYINEMEHTGFSIQYKDLWEWTDAEEQVKQELRLLYADPFNLETGPLLRVALYRLSDQRWVFSYVMHHIISDSWSMEILIRELLTIYNTNLSGENIELPELQVQYKDYACWQQQQLASPEMEEHRQYWINHFKGGVPVLDISRRQRPAEFTYKGNYRRTVIDRETTAQLTAITQTYNGSFFITLLAFVKLLLFHYTQKSRIMAGTSFAGREQENLENQIGLYINNLPLLTSITPGMCWKEYYAEVKETVVNAIKHQAYPLDEMIDDIGYKPDKSRPGIFNVLVELHTAVITEPVQGPGGFTIKPFDKQFTTTNFDLGFECKLEQDETGILIQYNTDLFEPEEIELLKERLLGLIQRIISDQDITIAQTGFTAGEGRNEKNGAFSFSASEKF
jgi:hypothetical protein